MEQPPATQQAAKALISQLEPEEVAEPLDEEELLDELLDELEKPILNGEKVVGFDITVMITFPLSGSVVEEEEAVILV